MKRLLAAGSGAIYQMCKVFRQGEAGRNHNPEFTLIEWYQPGMHYRKLMEQLDELVRLLLKGKLILSDSVSYTYQQVFEKFTGINPHTVNSQQLQTVLSKNNIQLHEQTLTHDAYLDLIMSSLVQPALPKGKPVFIYDYPPAQAALANIRQGEINVAERFELFINSIELANGYQELLDASEQQQRFENENKQRLAAGQQTIPVDDHLISALQRGMPMVSGVALGFERVLMLATGKDSIRDVIAFTTDKA
ncbi:Translation elongation factor P Lys34--(R)-beta-lysine ligase [hydrothermal vent metagenome]|uniref:Translation elongation factor P Lys34--(R)-beta-lysine ligase n=1 Tax=hydrothermal vent metagenome TaxID=652676 RepID=A0A3B1A3B1_9ZZZZ